jgi:mRNA interferase RelE/StbE
LGDGQEGTGPITWQIELTPTARVMLRSIKDRRVQQKVSEAIEGLAQKPEKQGKSLTGDLAGYRSLSAVGHRFRIIYKVERDRVIVIVVVVGIRKEGSKRDIYRLAERLVRLGLLEPTEERQE